VIDGLVLSRLASARSNDPLAQAIGVLTFSDLDGEAEVVACGVVDHGLTLPELIGDPHRRSVLSHDARLA
jgi:hypothetical protein